jgi:hypothetical protein
MFVGLTVGGAIGWWIGSYGGIGTALIVSTIGSLLSPVKIICKGRSKTVARGGAKA